MASAVFSDSILKAKFRGCMIGALLGDCVGDIAPNCMRRESPEEDLRNLINKLISEEILDDVELLYYTDDTCMTISIASSIAANFEINAKDLAERFVNEYYSNRERGYGMHVPMVFHKLKESKFDNVFLPASEQFGGSGSFGNGAAMRTAPIALFGNNKGEEYIVDAAKECALITHAHPDGYNGAILQCLAVNIALGLDPSQDLDPICFINNLLEKMENIEKTKLKPYCESLKIMKKICLKNQDDVSSNEIAKCLGNGEDISALKSVPTAIYSFLRGMKPIKNCFENSNPFLRTLFFAISVGGDTDTIGTMACSIAGAYYGEDVIPGAIQKRCESIDEVISLADRLFDAAYKKE